MVPRQPVRLHRRLVDEVRIEVLVGETGLRCVQRRVGEVARLTWTSVSAGVSVTCSASQKYSASERYRVTWRGAR